MAKTSESVAATKALKRVIRVKEIAGSGAKGEIKRGNQAMAARSQRARARSRVRAVPQTRRSEEGVVTTADHNGQVDEGFEAGTRERRAVHRTPGQLGVLAVVWWMGASGSPVQRGMTQIRRERGGGESSSGGRAKQVFRCRGRSRKPSRGSTSTRSSGRGRQRRAGAWDHNVAAQDAEDPTRQERGQEDCLAGAGRARLDVQRERARPEGGQRASYPAPAGRSR